MQPRTTPNTPTAAIALLITLIVAGCATAPEKVTDQKIVIDGNQYVTVEPPVGSHMKRRVKLVDLKEPGLSPTQRSVVTQDSDTSHILPPTSGEMDPTRNAQPGGR